MARKFSDIFRRRPVTGAPDDTAHGESQFGGKIVALPFRRWLDGRYAAEPADGGDGGAPGGRRVVVRVTRPSTTARTKQGYFAPTR